MLKKLGMQIITIMNLWLNFLEKSSPLLLLGSRWSDGTEQPPAGGSSFTSRTPLIPREMEMLTCHFHVVFFYPFIVTNPNHTQETEELLNLVFDC